MFTIASSSSETTTPWDKEEDLISACWARLAGYKRPKAIRFIGVDELPRSTTGKIQRHELEKWLSHGETTIQTSLREGRPGCKRAAQVERARAAQVERAARFGK